MQNSINIELDVVKLIAGKYSMPYLDTLTNEWIIAEGDLLSLCDMKLEHLIYSLNTLKKNNTSEYLKFYDEFVKKELHKIYADKEITNDMVEYVRYTTKNLIETKISEIEKEIRNR